MLERNDKKIGSCPLCRSDKFSKIGKPKISSMAQPHIDQEYEIVQCNDCSIYFVSPSISFTGEVWSKLYGEEYFGEMTCWWFKKRMRDITERFNRLEKWCPNKIERFLDIGSGEGYFLIESQNRSWETHGVDIYDNRIDKAKGDGVSFVNGDIFSADYPDDFFDCVYMDSVLEHVPDPHAYLKEINRILKKGGVFYIGVPNEDSLFNDIRQLINTLTGKRDYSARIKPFVSPFHINGFTAKTLRFAAKKTNFKICDIFTFGGIYDFLKFKPFSTLFTLQMILLPTHLLAVPLKKQTYIDTVFRKN